MDKKHLEKIACIKCGGTLESSSAADELTNGIIKCRDCGESYPVINNIPRLLTGNLMARCLAYYYRAIKNEPELTKYYDKYMQDNQGLAGSKIEKLKAETQKSFGYEWRMWKKLPDFAENHFLKVMGKNADFFAGKTGWDPAIGIGKELQNALLAVGETGFMTGSDLSYSVDIAYERCGKNKNLLIVQADLYTDFIRDNSLDFVYMVGLIQHLTGPEKGVEQAYKKVKRGGYFVGTIYQKPADFITKMVVNIILFMRIFTLRLPLPVVVLISRICAIPAYLFFKLPNFILKRTTYVKQMEDLYSAHQTQKRKPDLDLLALNWFDHFTAPVIGFYSDEQIMGILKNIQLNDFQLQYGIFRGFKK